jgi:hypothetical protein
VKQIRPFSTLTLAGVLVGITAAIPASAGVLEFSSAFNFREVRSGDTTPGDDLLVGIDVVDSDTNQTPDGAVVKARNTNTNEVFDLPPPGSTGFFKRIEYSADRAAGQIVIEVQSPNSSGSALLDAFGTGPGTGVIPGVTNLTATGVGTNRGLTWSTPDEVVNQTANDGNINRLRVRLRDPNGAQPLDLHGLSLSNAASLNATSFSFDPSLFTSNGVYTAQLMTEGFNPFNRANTFKNFLVDDVAGLGGTPVNITSTSVFRDLR